MRAGTVLCRSRLPSQQRLLARQAVECSFRVRGFTCECERVQFWLTSSSPIRHTSPASPWPSRGRCRCASSAAPLRAGPWGSPGRWPSPGSSAPWRFGGRGPARGGRCVEQGLRRNGGALGAAAARSPAGSPAAEPCARPRGARAAPSRPAAVWAWGRLAERRGWQRSELERILVMLAPVSRLVNAAGVLQGGSGQGLPKNPGGGGWRVRLRLSAPGQLAARVHLAAPQAPNQDGGEPERAPAGRGSVSGTSPSRLDMLAASCPSR